MTVAVVGGGISGLALAHALIQRGRDAVVLEASAQPGGKIATRAKDGFLLEAGPNGFLDAEPATLALAEALGLTPRLRRAEATAKRRFIYTRGVVREVPASPKLIVSRLISVPAKLRLLVEPFTRPGPEGDESLADFMRRHIGREATDVLVDAVQSGIYAGDPERMSAAAVFPRLAELDRKFGSLLVGFIRSRRDGNGGPRRGPSTLCSFEGGLTTLISALAERLGERVRCSAGVKGLSRTAERWCLALEGGASVEADEVVLGVPAYAAAPLVRAFDAGAAEAMEGIPYAPVCVVHLGYAPGTVAQPPQGFGFLVPHREGRPLLGCLYVSSFFPWRAPAGAVLLTCMLGGARHREVLSLDEAGLVALARDQVRDTLGIRVEPSLTEVFRWERAIPQYELGHLDRLARVERGLGRLPNLYAFGNAYRGIGLNDCVRQAGILAESLPPPASGGGSG
jgi:oxygen-dependent protoporphyrinogen oxidase